VQALDALLSLPLLWLAVRLWESPLKLSALAYGAVAAVMIQKAIAPHLRVVAFTLIGIAFAALVGSFVLQFASMFRARHTTSPPRDVVPRTIEVDL